MREAIKKIRELLTNLRGGMDSYEVENIVALITTHLNRLQELAEHRSQLKR